MLKASKHEANFKIRNRLRPVRDDHVIGTRWKHSNMCSRGVLISRFLLGNLTATNLAKRDLILCSVTWYETMNVLFFVNFIEGRK